MTDHAQILADYAHRLTYDALPGSAVNAMRLLILDYFAASYAGYRMNAAFNRAAEDVLFSQGGRAEATVFMSDKRLPISSAAFMNAVYAHGADMDDGHRKAMGHVGAHVISAVFALAQAEGASEQEVITALMIGYEVYVRISAAVQPGLVKRGFHSTGTAGAVACAAACAKLLGLDADGIYNAMAVAVTQAAGLLIVAESGQMVKPINPARAAQAGILSAQLVKRGVRGARYPLDSGKGWFHAMSDTLDGDMITRGLGTEHAACGCYIKPYPSCRHTHCGIEAAIALHARAVAGGVEAVRVHIYKNAIDIAGQIVRPESADDTKFSIHYSLACALAHGRFGLDDLDPDNMDEAAAALLDKITLVEDSAMENRDAGIRGARVDVALHTGETLSETVLIPKGDPEKPFTADDMRAKLAACAAGIIGEDAQSALLNRVMALGAPTRFDYDAFFYLG